MSRKSKREIERAIEQLNTEEGDMDIAEIESEVTTVTPENIGKKPEKTVPDDATILPTESDVVTWWVEPAEVAE